MSELALIANHPLVKLCWHQDTFRWAFARYYVAVQARTPELLSMRDMIERYRTSDLSEIAEVMRV